MKYILIVFKYILVYGVDNEGEYMVVFVLVFCIKIVVVLFLDIINLVCVCFYIVIGYCLLDILRVIDVFL